MRTQRHLMLIPLVTLLVILLAACSRTEELDPVNKSSAGLALKGYDTVAYFTENKPVLGSEQYQLTWNGARWQFANAEHRDAFARNPEKYAPRYGGYCSYAVSRGYTANGDPEAWKIVDGKLYLNYSREVRQLWEQDVPGNIARGNENWPGFLKRKPEHKG